MIVVSDSRNRDLVVVNGNTLAGFKGAEHRPMVGFAQHLLCWVIIVVLGWTFYQYLSKSVSTSVAGYFFLVIALACFAVQFWIIHEQSRVKLSVVELTSASRVRFDDNSLSAWIMASLAGFISVSFFSAFQVGNYFQVGGQLFAVGWLLGSLYFLGVTQNLYKRLENVTRGA